MLLPRRTLEREDPFWDWLWSHTRIPVLLDSCCIGRRRNRGRGCVGGLGLLANRLPVDWRVKILTCCCLRTIRGSWRLRHDAPKQITDAKGAQVARQSTLELEA